MENRSSRLIETKAYQQAFVQYLRRGTPLERAIKAAEPEHETRYYIWRTQGDDRVRPAHAALDGEIFAWDDPTASQPGTEPGCRCWAEPVPELPEDLPPIPEPASAEDVATMLATLIGLLLAGAITLEIVAAFLIRRFGIKAANEILREIRKQISERSSGTTTPATKPPLRRQYEAEVRNLKKLEEQLRQQKKPAEEIARTLSSRRREIGEKYKDLTPANIRDKIYKRNLERYGDERGPTIDELRGRGKSWEDIIESAQTPGGGDLF